MTHMEMETLLKSVDHRTSLIEQILPTLATKEDLERFATKEDLSAFAQRIVLKIGELMDQVQALKEQSATKAEMGNYVSAVDKVSKDDEFLWNKDLVQDERLRGLEDQGKRHADRISSLEGRTSP